MKPEHLKWLDEYGQPSYWNKFSPYPFKSFPLFFRLYYNWNDNKLRKFLKMQTGQILDLGCGSGRFLGYADVGVDFSKGMIQYAKRRGKSIVLASILHLPFKDNSFDEAFMADASVHIPPTERKAAYKEAKRVAKTFYDFLGEDRTSMPFVMSSLEGIPLPMRVKAYLALLFCFPVDRVRKLVVSNGHYA